MSEHGSEPATLKDADYEWSWLRTSRSEGCWLWVNMAQNQPLWRMLTMSDHSSEPAALKAADYEWSWLRTSHSEGCCLRVKLHTSVAKFVMPAVTFYFRHCQHSLCICYSDIMLTGWPLVWKTWKCQGIWQLSGKCQDFTENQGIVREKLPKTVYCKLHICVHTGI